MGMKEYDKDYTTILNLPKENVKSCDGNVRSSIMTSVKPPLPWREQIEKSRRIRSSFSWEDFSDHQHKSRLQVFQRRTGLMAEDVDADALKKSLKRSKKVKSQDTMSIESWKSTSSREIRIEEKILFDIQRGEIEALK